MQNNGQTRTGFHSGVFIFRDLPIGESTYKASPEGLTKRQKVFNYGRNGNGTRT